jgi:hypothetical protein
VSVSGSGLEAEVVTWSEAKDNTAAISCPFYGKKVASCTVKEEQSSDRYVHSVETSSNEKDRSVNIITEREQNTVLILVRLTEQEDSSK